MRLWLDEQLPPALAPWLTERFGVEVISVRDLGLARARDAEIFSAARLADAIVVTKDQDFVRLLGARGHPPQVIGNTSNEHLRRALAATLPAALALVRAGEPLVEIRDAALVKAVAP